MSLLKGLVFGLSMGEVVTGGHNNNNILGLHMSLSWEREELMSATDKAQRAVKH